ncbi:MAG: hypothetical protein IJ083_05295 [Clostridia bacterium]|nr:hypothetical protein [Clostridia bacterium]
MASELISSANTLLAETFSALRDFCSTSTLNVYGTVLVFGASCRVIQPMTSAERLTCPPLRIGSDMENNASYTRLLPLIMDRNVHLDDYAVERLPAQSSATRSLGAKVQSWGRSVTSDGFCLCLFTDGMLSEKSILIRNHLGKALFLNAAREHRFLVRIGSRAEWMTMPQDRIQAILGDGSVQSAQVWPQQFPQQLVGLLTDWEEELLGKESFHSVFD